MCVGDPGQEGGSGGTIDRGHPPKTQLPASKSEIETVAGNAGSNVGTGGMQTKIKAVKIALASGIPSFIGNANKDNIAYDAVYGKAKGTYFMVKTKKISLNHQEVLSTV